MWRRAPSMIPVAIGEPCLRAVGSRGRALRSGRSRLPQRFLRFSVPSRALVACADLACDSAGVSVDHGCCLSVHPLLVLGSLQESRTRHDDASGFCSVWPPSRSGSTTIMPASVTFAEAQSSDTGARFRAEVRLREWRRPQVLARRSGRHPRALRRSVGARPSRSRDPGWRSARRGLAGYTHDRVAVTADHRARVGSRRQLALRAAW